MLNRLRRNFPARHLWFPLTVFAPGICAQDSQPASQPSDPVRAALQDLGSRIKLDFDLRYRGEMWSFFDEPRGGATATQSRYAFHGLRSLVGTTYTDGDISLRAQGLDLHLWSLPDNAIGGPGQTYFANSGLARDPDTLNLQALHLRWQNLLTSGLSLRVGRQEFIDGLCSPYEDAKWNRLRAYTLTERLVGQFGWSQASRSFDGARLELARPGWFAQAYGGRVNAGGFDVDDATHALEEFHLGGLEVIAKAGTLLPATELRGFGIWSKDNRAVARCTLGDAIHVQTFGASALSMDTLGPGQWDALLWGAGQIGDYGSADHRAFAGIAEIGYHWTQAFAKPWLRAGVAWASGDNSPNQGTHRDFYNLLPTNHKWYGYSDQVAFSNVRDLYLELLLHPCKQVTAELQYHRFHAADAASPIVFGSGAFTQSSLGYGTRPTNGSSDIGQELDLVVTWKPVDSLEVQTGYCRFFGGDLYESQFVKSDLDFFYVQVTGRF